ncbi:MAG TPA: hypothetical protein VG326_02410 [Tepidisphaeraceae bacterium]|jgi:hypothetical protein|nr:hypothetical protein [Tepidisphaeraceae bacterium]
METNRQCVVVLGIAAMFGLASTHTQGAEVQKAGVAAVPAPSAAAPTGAAHPNGVGNAAPPANTAAEHAGANGTAGATRMHERRNSERAARTVYVPGYGYANWTGDYNTPWWNTPGTWYANGDYQQSPDNTGAAAPAVPSPRVQQEEAARAEMMAARARLSRDFESKDNVRSALGAVQQAEHDYDGAVADLTRRLAQDPAYAEAEAQKEKDAQKVAAARADARRPAPVIIPGAATQAAPISQKVVNAAEQKLNAASLVTAILAERERSDPAVKNAREKLDAATERLNGMKDNFDAALKADPQWQAASQKLDAARASVSP